MTNTTKRDPLDLNRFISAQDIVYERILAELKNGSKRSHWMWYICRQLDGLTQSTTSKYYAIKSIEETIARCLTFKPLWKIIQGWQSFLGVAGSRYDYLTCDR